MKYFINKLNKVKSFDQSDLIILIEDENGNIIKESSKYAKKLKKDGFIEMTDKEFEENKLGSFDDQRLRLHSEIITMRDSFLEKGVTYKNSVFYSDKESNKDLFIFGVSTKANGIDVPVWKGKDGYLVNPTMQELQELYTLCATRLSTAYIKEMTLSAMLSSTEDKKLKSFDVQKLWDKN